MRKIIIAALSALVILFYCSVSAFASAVDNAWLIERNVFPTQNFSPTMYTSLSDAPTTGASVPFMTKVEQIINSAGSEVNHWEGTGGSTSGVHGSVSYGWQSSGGDKEDVYWLLTSYTITMQKDSGVTQASTYYSTAVDGVNEIDAISGSFSLGVATMSVVCTLYRSSAPVTGNTAFVTSLNVHYTSGTYSSDGMFWPIIKPQYYTNSDQALQQLENIEQSIDDLREDLMGTASHPAIDEMSGTTADVQSRADAVLDGLNVGNIEYSTPAPIVVDTNASGVLSWIFSLDFVWTLVLTSCGLWVAKVVLYGIG